MSSPYLVLKNWFVDGNKNSVLDNSVCEIVNPRAVLGMLCTMGEVTIFVNDIFNKYSVMLRNFKEATDDYKLLYLNIKEIIMAYNPQYHQFSFIGKKKKDDNFLGKEFPLLKPYEIPVLIDTMTEDEKNIFNQTIGIDDPKKRKLTKKEMPKKQRNKIKDPDVWTYKEWELRMIGIDE